jgi:uncharacterized protein YaaN involved in tellurite resistance
MTEQNDDVSIEAEAAGARAVPEAALTAYLPADTPLDPARLAAAKAELDMGSANSILNFGAAAEKSMADFADQVLDQVLAAGFPDIQGKLKEIRDIASGLHPEKLTAPPGFLSRLMGGLAREIQRFSKGFSSARARIDAVAADLEDQVEQTRHGLIVLQRLFERNEVNFHELSAYIRAGHEVMEEQRAGALPALRDKAASGDAMAGQRFRDLESSLDRLDRKLMNLEKSRSIALSVMPTIRQVQETGVLLIEELKSAVMHAVPAWKTTMVVTIEQLRQKHRLGTLAATTEFTNEQLRQMARQLDENTVETARQSARGIADADVIAESIQSLIATLDKVGSVEAEARQARARSRETLREAEAKLRARIASADRPAISAPAEAGAEDGDEGDRT